MRARNCVGPGAWERAWLDHAAIDILEATGSYVVLYKGQPFSLRKTIINNYIDAPKYLRTYYPTPSHAWNLADKLNARYDTTEFTVQEIHTGRILPRPTPE
jgi:hypothetical protein